MKIRYVGKDGIGGIIMNYNHGERGIMCQCVECGEYIFLRAMYGTYVNQDGHAFVYPSQYEELPEGWGTNSNGYPICPRCIIKTEHGVSELMTIWARLGVTMYVTKKQYETIIGDDRDKAAAELKDVINNGWYEPDGNSYIPRENGEEIEFDI